MYAYDYEDEEAMTNEQIMMLEAPLPPHFFIGVKGQTLFQFPFFPDKKKLRMFLNGELLELGVDYDIEGDKLEWLNPLLLEEGDRLYYLY